MNQLSDQSESHTQWRTVTRHPRHGDEFALFDTEHEAREYARLERIDYPHLEVWVERREVTPWVPEERAFDEKSAP